jgi:hypothetical protein
MPNYSMTKADGTREVRDELYDGTARIVVTAANGTVVSDQLVPSDELPPVEEVDPELAEQVATLTAVIEDIGGALGSLTPTSTTTATRNALLNVRAAIDAALGGS